ncbi:MAG: hypothetical protein M3416_04175 [Acidobacteriota bacterium]|nr:hypothetical protein [Acidobacteriota bacterium]
MHLIQELRNDAIDDKVSLATTLRKAKVLASLLKHDEFKSWIDKELNGYRQDDPNVPDYRISYAESFGNFRKVGFVGGISELNNYHIPKFAVPKHLKDYVETLPITQGVRSLESLLEKQEFQQFRVSWSGDAVVAASSIYRNFECLTAWRDIGASEIVHILDTIRNRLLSFILELEELYPAISESEDAISHIPKEQTNAVFQTIVLGNAVVSNDASSHYVVEQNTTINDLSALAGFMRKIGIQGEDIEELERAITEDGAIVEKGKFGSNVAGWMGKMVKKAAEGTWKVALDIAPKLIINALSKYYGWEK